MLSSADLFFLFPRTPGAGNERGASVRHIAHRNGVNSTTTSRIMKHAILQSHEALKEDDSVLACPKTDEREGMHGLVPGFPLCIGFVDAAKIGQ